MNKFKYILGFSVVLVFMSFALIVGYTLAFNNLIYPRVKVAGIEVTGMDKVTALRLVTTYFESQPSSVTLVSGGVELSKLEGLKIKQDLVWAIDQAMGVGRSGNILTQVSERVKTLYKGVEIKAPVILDRDELNDQIGQVSDKLEQKPVWPKLTLEGQKVTVSKGKNGVEVKKDQLLTSILDSLTLPGEHKIEVPTSVVDTSENSELTKSAQDSLEKWGDKKLTINFRDFEKKLGKEELVGLFGLTGGVVDSRSFDKLISEIKGSIETEPRDAVFIFENNKVNNFKPEVVGATIDIPSFNQKLAVAILAAEEVKLEVPVILTYPKVKTGDINNLGIKELLGTGKSTFFHSIPGRVFNVNLAASRVNGTLVPPGEEFSFNRAVGDISKATGYQTAYIISQGRTVLGDGGGVCQVSTTTFRAALDAGFPITERKAHAYRVGYYEQDSLPGIDASIYYPSADFKFLNDTGHHILIQEEVDTKKLTMKVSIYGTSDGRKSTLSKPVMSSQIAPPPTMYVDDPTLPAGTTKQIDWSAWGAKVSFNYKVERGGENIYEKTFVSNYQPWQAVYLRGTRQ